MSCYVCNLSDSLTCSKCINLSYTSKLAKLKQLRELQNTKKQVLSSLLTQIPESKCKSLQVAETLKRKKLKLNKGKKHQIGGF